MEAINIGWPQLQLVMCANLFQSQDRDFASLMLFHYDSYSHSSCVIFKQMFNKRRYKHTGGSAG